MWATNSWHRGGLGDAANLSFTFDRDVQDMQLEVTSTGALQPVAARFDPRNGRFDVNFEIGNDSGTAPAKLHFTGSAIENEDNLQFSAARGVAPMTELMPFEEAPAAYERMMSGAARFRIVLDMHVS